MKVVIASHNAHKAEEICRLFDGFSLNIAWYNYATFEVEVEPIENAQTFAENALSKARFAVEHTGLPALADDSGLEVAALGGEPGVHSHRWAGDTSDAERNQLLLKRLGTAEDRSARFVCAMALVLPAGHYALTSGEIHGLITSEPRGGHGFGYDPIFLIPSLGATFGELSPTEKNAWSHRARAAQHMAPLLKGLLSYA
ncbi:MAG: RdgB/HAM1 family non-canonical purine NTP pyrophosphatase [Chloroflexi bacterium]|nr:RdgB/HAM1 family non-canonical purine NTP pyrophosphatase [Chloroflexota bacterium]MCL5946984.1 RdgB/HAM1 family non-canonical purine NTP pyrophosphatase [Chloroflexota bacterium]